MRPAESVRYNVTVRNRGSADVHNVKDFFANFYVPNNCSLVVAGDFKSADVKPLIASLFGTAL